MYHGTSWDNGEFWEFDSAQIKSTDYQKAYLAGDTAEMSEIAKALMAFRKYGIVYTANTLEGWRKNAKEDLAK